MASQIIQWNCKIHPRQLHIFVCSRAIISFERKSVLQSLSHKKCPLCCIKKYPLSIKKICIFFHVDICQTDVHSIPGCRHCNDNAPFFLVCRMGDYRIVQDHSGHGVQVTSSLALKPRHVAGTAAAEDETMTAGTLLLTLQVHSWHLQTTGILLLTQPVNPSSRYWIVKANSSTLRLPECILPYPEKIMDLMQNAGLSRSQMAWQFMFSNSKTFLFAYSFLGLPEHEDKDTFLQNAGNYRMTQCHSQEEWELGNCYKNLKSHMWPNWLVYCVPYNKKQWYLNATPIITFWHLWDPSS